MSSEEKVLKVRNTRPWTRPACFAVGSYNPVSHKHKQLFEGLALYSADAGLESLVVALTPSPGRLLHGDKSWAQAHNHESLEREIYECGVDHVLTIDLSAADLSLGAADFFSLILECGPLAELWLGANQSLGSGTKGNVGAILSCASELGIEVRQLKEIIGAPNHKVRGYLLRGDLDRAAEDLGYRPHFSRPDDEHIVFAGWKPKSYQCKGVRPDGSCEQLSVEVCASSSGGSYFQWPCTTFEKIYF